MSPLIKIEKKTTLQDNISGFWTFGCLHCNYNISLQDSWIDLNVLKINDNVHYDHTVRYLM